MGRWVALVLGSWIVGCYESHTAPGMVCGRRIEVSSSGCFRRA